MHRTEGTLAAAMQQDAPKVEAELTTSQARIQLVRYHVTGPAETILYSGNRFRVELCLGSRHWSARGCFRGRWKPTRFERIGDLFLVPPGEVLRARSDGDKALSAIVCELDRSSIIELMDEIPELTDQLLVASLDIRQASIRNLFLRLAEEIRHPGFASETLAELVVAEISIELVRRCASLLERQTRAGLASWQLRLIDERLKEVRPAPSLEELASLCRISVRQLTRGFRASRGCSVGAHVANCQVDHARKLLACGGNVTSVAAALGFSSCSNFCFAFRRATGIAPGQYQRMVIRD